MVRCGDVTTHILIITAFHLAQFLSIDDLTNPWNYNYKPNFEANSHRLPEHSNFIEDHLRIRNLTPSARHQTASKIMKHNSELKSLKQNSKSNLSPILKPWSIPSCISPIFACAQTFPIGYRACPALPADDVSVSLFIHQPQPWSECVVHLSVSHPMTPLTV